MKVLQNFIAYVEKKSEIPWKHRLSLFALKSQKYTCRCECFNDKSCLIFFCFEHSNKMCQSTPRLN